MGEKIDINQQTWLQTVTSQHAVHATLTGLEVNALILFVSFRHSLEVIEKIIFIFSVLLICISTILIVWMVEHERRAAYDKMGGTTQVTLEENELENRLRNLLNKTKILSIISISLLLIISVMCDTAI